MILVIDKNICIPPHPNPSDTGDKGQLIYCFFVGRLMACQTCYNKQIYKLPFHEVPYFLLALPFRQRPTIRGNGTIYI